MKKTKLFFLSLLITVTVYGQGNFNQGRIDAVFGQSFATQQNHLKPLIIELKGDESANAYWIAYAQFRSSIFYQQTGKTDKAAFAVNDAIKLLQAIKDKNSEEHALLGYILGYSISFDPSGAGRLSAKATAEYRASLKKNENNMRAYLGLGESDLHKPVAYGGGEKVEEYLLKALSLPDKSGKDGPTWGKNLAYHTLAKYYLREGQTDKAKIYCMQGLSKYPQDMQLNQLKQSF